MCGGGITQLNCVAKPRTCVAGAYVATTEVATNPDDRWRGNLPLSDLPLHNVAFIGVSVSLVHTLVGLRLQVASQAVFPTPDSDDALCLELETIKLRVHQAGAKEVISWTLPEAFL